LREDEPDAQHEDAAAATAPTAPGTAPAPKAEVADKTPAARLRRHLLVLLCVAVLSVPAYFLVSRFVVTAVIVQGRSMTPTLQDGDRYYLNRWRYLFVSPQRGDIVVIRDPGHNDFAVKRIVAQPLDWINLRDGQIFINGRRMEEPYLEKNTRTDAPDLKEKWVQLGPDQYYVLGDNRANSEDSRFYGRVQGKDILGLLVK
jgi:signal peptidase I